MHRLFKNHSNFLLDLSFTSRRALITNPLLNYRGNLVQINSVPLIKTMLRRINWPKGTTLSCDLMHYSQQDPIPKLQLLDSNGSLDGQGQEISLSQSDTVAQTQNVSSVNQWDE